MGLWSIRYIRRNIGNVAIDMALSDFAPLVDWNLPYNANTLMWSLEDAEQIGVVPFDATAPLFESTWKAAIVESPPGVWCTWAIQEGAPVQWAPTLPSHDKDFGELSMHQMKRVCPATM